MKPNTPMGYAPAYDLRNISEKEAAPASGDLDY